MRLADRGRGQRLSVEGGKRLLDGLAELAGEDLGDLVGWDRGHVRLQVRELGGERLGQQVAAGGGDLPELDEHPA